MNITDEARDHIIQVLKGKSVNGIRVYFAGFG
jgi:hypothetical protein